MFNNRKYINQLMKEIDKKENTICNMLDLNKELSQENQYLRDKIKRLEDMIRFHENNECKLNKKVVKYKRIIEKLNNYTQVLEGGSE